MKGFSFWEGVQCLGYIRLGRIELEGGWKKRGGVGGMKGGSEYRSAMEK